MPLWNLWHGCTKISEGCRNCYVYRADAKYGRDSTAVVKTRDFNLPVRKNRKGDYKIPFNNSETVYTCFTSDFFLSEADEWRPEAWEMIKERSDLKFMFITKRIHRFYECIPNDWGEGYDNVTICCTVENNDRARFRLPIFLNAPIKHKQIICEPLLEEIDLSPYLNSQIEYVSVGGESGEEARICRFEWIKSIREQCVNANVAFHFKQTGAKFVKDSKLYLIKRQYQHSQAKKAKMEFTPFKNSTLI